MQAIYSMAETEKYMNDNNLFNDEILNFRYGMRKNYMLMTIEYQTIKLKNVGYLNDLTQETLQDQFRKLRNYFDSSDEKKNN